ncbi:long-chain acyl-CoA synthetase [Rhodopseudomonas rhenobacensis]|uniref:Long-chain acyl-CoA synthetase n=1 Tax=Rhodopseudomonas rhenobacensis TaxID=87461 RepID=A0A7W7Z1I3_9BRAD|nr:AMP-binding protein [Rhodopseudomonas rhenobacensis]MBB5046198.1 long-chain acyl-CoA synthetase [Rhodopseudomonas rhenobacensis]
MTLNHFTLADVYRRNAALVPQRTAFVVDGRRVSHRDYLARVTRLAAGLARQGVGPGDRVAILSQNALEMIDLIGAVAWLGAILLPVNVRLNAEEIGFVLADGAPVVLIVGPDYQAIVAPLLPSLPSLRRCFIIGEAAPPFAAFAELSDGDDDAPEHDVDGDAGFVIIHTAAVGGRPRGALLSQHNLLIAQSSLIEAFGLSEHDVNLGVLPLFHVTGLGLMLTAQQAGGASLIAAKFDPAQAARDIAAERVTLLASFAPMLANILDHAGSDQLASLRAVTGLDSPETIERFEAMCPNARFWSTYGQSETSGLATLSPYRARPKSAGRPLFWRSLAVVDADDTPLPAGEVGEIVLRGPTVFKGYWNNEAATAHALRNGWHHTGDMGRFDSDGYLWYAGRAPEKDLIKTGGENVYPAEVEAAIRAHPGIAEVVVIGVPDPQWSEAIKAVCVCRDGAKPSAADVADFVAGQIARFKKPKHVVFVTSLPKTTTGAIDRAAVKAAHGEG